jgi:cholesterol transport system auxiliary component
MRRRFIATMTLLLAGGCSLWQPAPQPDVALHVLEARPAPEPMAARRELVLAVSVPRAAPGADSAAMAYVQKPHAIEHFATHRWADAPARLLAPLLVRTLDDAGSFRAVVAATSGVPADLRLDSEIVQLRQSFLVKPSRIELVLRAQLVDVPGRRVLATRTIEITQDAASDDAPGGVAAANAAVARALAHVAAFCVEASAPARASALAGAARR